MSDWAPARRVDGSEYEAYILHPKGAVLRVRVDGAFRYLAWAGRSDLGDVARFLDSYSTKEQAMQAVEQWRP